MAAQRSAAARARQSMTSRWSCIILPEPRPSQVNTSCTLRPLLTHVHAVVCPAATGALAAAAHARTAWAAPALPLAARAWSRGAVTGCSRRCAGEGMVTRGAGLARWVGSLPRDLACVRQRRSHGLRGRTSLLSAWLGASSLSASACRPARKRYAGEAAEARGAPTSRVRVVGSCKPGLWREWSLCSVIPAAHACQAFS